MNISTDYINSEITKIVNIKYNLLVIYSDAILKGNLTMIQSLGKDISMLNILNSCLTNCIVFERDNNFINDAIMKAREYINALSLTSYVDFFSDTYICTSCPNISTVLPGITINNSTTNNTTNIYSVTYSSDWESQDLGQYVTEVGQTIIYNIELETYSTDIDTIILEVQGDNPEYTTTGNGYHISNNILYWHDMYNLRPNMQIKLRWKLA